MKFNNQPSEIFKDKEILLLEDDLLWGKRIATFVEKNFDQLKSDRQLSDKMLTAKSPSTITTLLSKVY